MNYKKYIHITMKEIIEGSKGRGDYGIVPNNDALAITQVNTLYSSYWSKYIDSFPSSRCYI